MAVVVDEQYYKGIAQMLDVMPERVIRYRLADLTILYCNAAWAAGHRVDLDDVVGRRLDDLLSSAEMVGLRAQLKRIGPDSPIVADDVPRAAPFAPGQWVEWVDQYVVGPDGPEVLAVGRDVTGRHIAELNLADSEARFRDLADKSADVVWRFSVDPYPHFDYMSPSVERILGWSAQLFIDDFTYFLDILDEEGRDFVHGLVAGTTTPERRDLNFRSADGRIVIGEMQTTVIRNGLQGITRDVTELRQLQDDLALLALRDPLTGLANRRLLFEMLGKALARSKRSGNPLAVAFLDLDGFKRINDNHGHEAGDAVLCETARRLLAVVRDADVVARLGGDEFVVVYEPGPTTVGTIIPRLEAALAPPIALGPTTFVNCPASIGHADTLTAGHDGSALIAAADAAMYEVKKTRDHTRHS